MNHFGIAPSSTVFIGDSPKDKVATENANCNFIWVHELVADIN